MMTTEIINYRAWLEENVTLEDPFSQSSLRVMMKALLLGKNYRLLTEKNTKERLFTTYAWLLKTYDVAKSLYGDNWQIKLLDELLALKKKGVYEKNLTLWLLGLTKKTSDNLDISSSERVEFLKETIKYCDELFSKIGNKEQVGDAWLLLMAGHATLNIRGSQKACIGKTVEKIFAKTAFTLLGFELGKNFWIDVGRDSEVGREADVECESKRGRIRTEVCLIASGNQEVIEDKISRVGTNGIVICDRLGAKTRVYDTAMEKKVKLIQIRNNQPLLEMYDYLSSRCNFELVKPPSTEKEIRQALTALPDSFFKNLKDNGVP
jgi:hypothetical protein